MVGVVSAYCIVELSDKEVEKQVDEVVTKRGQAIGKVIESESKDLIIRTFKSLLFYLNERTVRGL